MLLHQGESRLTGGFERNVVDGLGQEGFDQQTAGFVSRDAAGLKIEKLGIVEIACGRAVGALHVVGVDLQHRL